MADWYAEAAKYFGKKRRGRSPMEEGMEEAAGIEQTPTLPSTLQEGTLYPLSAIPRKRVRDRSTEGSPPFSDKELKQGYRKVGNRNK